MSAIEFRSVAKIYRGRRVIDSLSFMIEAGERVVLFGPSGCGKSTTLLQPDWLRLISARFVWVGRSLRRLEEFTPRRSRVASAWCFRILRFGPT